MTDTASTAVRHYLDDFEQREQALAGAGLEWLSGTRREALQRFADSGFPTPRHEDWKYTRVAAIEKRAFRPLDKPCVGLDEDDLAPFLAEGLDCHRLVFVNGRYTRLLSRPGSLPEGARLMSLTAALEEHPEALRPHLARHADARAHAFTALNTAFLSDGAVLHLTRGCRLELPVHLLFLSTPQEDMVSHPRVLLVAEDGAEATVLESHAALGDAGYLNNTLTEVVLGAAARVRHYRLQQESTKAFHIGTLQVTQARDSQFDSLAVSVGALLSRVDINIDLAAQGAGCVLDGLYIAGGRQHVDFHTRVDHSKPHGTSRERYKGVLGGRARGVFNGRVYVHPDAQKTDAKQSNANLLLSRDAEIDTKPQLEIYANDVKCAHGATVGQLDETMVFYLRSRGLDEAMARNLLTWGFVREMLDHVPDPAIREWLSSAALGALPGADNVRNLLS